MHRKKIIPLKGIINVGKKPILEKNDVLHFFILIIGGFCLVKEIDIYRLTFVPSILPASIFFVAGVVASIVSKKTISDGVTIFSMLCFWGYNMITWGSIVSYSFMLFNFSFAETNSTVFSSRYNQSDIGHLAKGRYGCVEPWVEISYKGFAKQIVFPCDSSVEKYNAIHVSVRKVSVGYDVIQSQSLLNY